MSQLIIPKEDAIKLRESLEELNVPKWKRKYESIGVLILDGGAWRLKVVFDNGKKIYRSGVNAYPENFHLLEELIE